MFPSSLHKYLMSVTLPSTVESETTGPADSYWQPEQTHAHTHTQAHTYKKPFIELM